MKLSVLVLLVAVSLAATQPEEWTRSKRSIGSWFTGFFKKWKKQPEPRPVIKVPVVHPRPVYHPPVVHHHKVRYPPPVAHVKPYGPPPRPPSHYGAPAGGHIKGHGGGGHIKGHGGGGHIKGHGGGGHIKGHGGGGHIKGHGGGGHIKGHGGGGHTKGHGHGAGIPYGFGPLKDSDVLQAGGSYHPPPPPAQTYDVPPPPLDIYGPPKPVDSYVPPPHPVDPHITPSVPIAPPVVPPVVEDSYSPPVVPVAPAVPDLSNDYRAPPSFPPPMAAHGSSSSSYLDGFEPSQPIPVAPVVPAPPVAPTGPLAPLPPLYNLPSESHSAEVGSALPPAPVQVLAPSAGKVDATGGKRSIDGGSGVIIGGYPGLATSGAAPAVYGAELGYDDPIIEIVFEEGEPAPAPPPPVIDPELFALQEEPVEVFFIEYSPGDNIDDLAALKLDEAQQGILHDLPQELPLDVRTRLLESGVLDDAEVQVIELDEALTSDYLDRDTRQALEAVYASESRIAETKVESPSKEAVEVKVHRLQEEEGTPAAAAELVSGLGKFREGRYVGVVEANDEQSEKFLPVVVDGDKLPLPDHPGIEGREVAGVLVLASEEEEDEASDPPANASDPEHNLVESASSLQPVVVEARPSQQPIDRQWHGDPNDWRPVWRY